MFTAALLTTARPGSSPSAISRWVDNRPVAHSHSGTLLGCKQEGNLTFCDYTHGPSGHHAKWNKPFREGQILYDSTYTWNLMNKINKQNRNRLMDKKTDWQLPGGRGGGWVKEVKGLSKNQNKKPRRPRQQYGDYQRERAGGGRSGQKRINGDGRRPDFGWWTHNTIYTWWIIECTLETYTILSNNVTPNKFNKNFLK